MAIPAEVFKKLSQVKLDPAAKSSEKEKLTLGEWKVKLQQLESMEFRTKVIPADQLHKCKPPETLKKTESLEEGKKPKVM